MANVSASCRRDDGARIQPWLVGIDRGHPNRETLMTSPAARNDTQIERVVSAAKSVAKKAKKAVKKMMPKKTKKAKKKKSNR